MVKLDSIDVLGAGPSGLYVAQLLKRHLPQTRVRVLEQNPRGATFGFGVVFSSKALDFLEVDDHETYSLITPYMEHWQNMTLVHCGESVIFDGIGFASIGRLKLIELLTARAEDQGVEVLFDTKIDNIMDLKADLLIGADGVNSLVRRSRDAAFLPEESKLNNHFAWFGADKPFDTLTQTFCTTECGAINAHHYRYQSDMSTFIVECDNKSFFAYGFNNMSENESAKACMEIFAETLDGAQLLTNKSQWRRFPKLWCKKWFYKNSVLIGDSAHTAHFSVGSGTRLAMEDAIALVKALRKESLLTEALEAYQEARQPIARKIVEAANTSAKWYETFSSKMEMLPLDLGFDYITRSGRVDLERLRSLSPNFMKAYETRNFTL